VKPGETPEAAALREMKEELGITPPRIEFAYEYLWRSQVETELIRAFATLCEGPFNLDPEEIDDGRFWSFDEINAAVASGVLSPQFCNEFPRMREWWRRKQASMTKFTR
jgi:8-oxo-dGTP pyrophosphatase MutT (NUDIX family)